MTPNTLKWGIIGGGLMGREFASALGRWIALTDDAIPPSQLVAVCDLNEGARNWFSRVPSVSQLTASADELLQNPDVDAVYIALPHHLHREFYLKALRAGKDLLAEKPFGIDLEAAIEVRDEAQKLGRFVRCSSEMPFFPGAQRVWKTLSQNLDSLGRILEIRAGFHHSSDLDPSKPANWKRQNKTCGENGVLNDLGMHVAHLPLRLGWKPARVYAQLQHGFPVRPDGRGGEVVCDTWDNALLHCDVEIGSEIATMRWEMKRMAPTETNTWFLEVLGTRGGVKFSTKTPKTLFVFENGKEQSWNAIDLGHGSAFSTVTGGIFEFGFPDSILQMLAAFAAERAGVLGDKFGMATPEEATASHQIWAAALRSQEEKRAVEV
ncbi:MAG: Gfo/Idh/MocA family oxidoreductase [Armatimonadetes bacterium]|nr:Gfo/Idh/MocA family oxidoreductase [Armatimonadota bacterium]